MKLHSDPQSICNRHGEVSAGRAKTIVAHLSGLPASRLAAIVGHFRKGDMPAFELALVDELVGIKPPSAPKPAPTAKIKPQKAPNPTPAKPAKSDAK